MLNKLLLLKHIDKSGKTMKEIADYLGISREGLYKKMKPLKDGGSEFKASEIYKISKILNLSKSDKEEIFFTPISE